MDFLFIEQLKTTAIIGIHKWEQECFQRLVFDLQLAYDTKLMNGDNSNDGDNLPYLDYTKVNQVILSLVKSQSFSLIEDVAEITADTLMKKFHILCWIRLKVSKPGALCNAHNVGVCIKRICSRKL